MINGRGDKMYIMGISCYYHDAAACIIEDGKIIAAAEEERFTRKKHDSSFPIKAIAYCLKEAGITAQQLNHISYYEKPVLKFQRILNQHLQMAPRSFRVFKDSLISWTQKMNVEKKIRDELSYTGPISFMEHHASHAASAFFPSPFENAAIVTIDGVGEWATTTIGIGKKNTVKLLKEIHFPHSIGLLYSTITALLGFSVNNSEYKVMGLSPYGNSKTYKPHFNKIIKTDSDGSFSLDMSYFDFHYRPWMPSRKLCKLLCKTRKPDEQVTQQHKDIAAALQQKTEEVMINLLKHAKKETGMENICLAGGVALNSVANGKLLKQTGFKNIWIQPAAGDSGNSIGAALMLYHVLGSENRQPQETAYLGPSFSDTKIKEFLDSHFIRYTAFKTKTELLKKVAKLIHGNNVIGWFQGRMEWGPRALGARSILSNPCNPKMQDILNLKVKHREKFRPFAPVVCVDDALTYFDCDEPIPLPTDFMLMVYPVKKEWHAKIPAVTHVDGSGRLQTVRREQNPLYYELIKEFGRLSGIPILINTSFNIRGEPIVCSPKDAYWCMMGTGIDYLVMGKFLIKRADNPEDMWDSEAIAGD